LSDALVRPLQRLRRAYEVAAAGIHQIIDGLGSLAGTLKGQRPGNPPGPATSADTAAAPPRTITVQARGRGFAELLAFQERISAIPEVTRVSVAAIDDEQATLVVELGGEIR